MTSYILRNVLPWGQIKVHQIIKILKKYLRLLSKVKLSNSSITIGHDYVVHVQHLCSCMLHS